MPRTKTQKVTPLSVRLPAEDRETLEAAAYKWGLIEDLVESTADANLSAFVRRIISEYLEGFCRLNGGRDAVIAEYRAARRAEAEDLLRKLDERL